jgi:hypothetical protein
VSCKGLVSIANQEKANRKESKPGGNEKPDH